MKSTVLHSILVQYEVKMLLQLDFLLHYLTTCVLTSRMLVHWSQGQNRDLLTNSERLNSDQAILFRECYCCSFVRKTMVGSSRHYHMKNHLWMIFVVLPGLVIIFFQYFIEFICCCDFACLVAVLMLFCTP